MANVVYTSKVHIERMNGPVRKAIMPGESQPVMFSVHGALYRTLHNTIALTSFMLALASP